MLNLALGYVVQADREREVAEDLRNRQRLQARHESRAAVRAPSPERADRPTPVRVQRTGG